MERERKTDEEDDFNRIEERDHHERELLGVGIMDREGVCGVKETIQREENEMKD